MKSLKIFFLTALVAVAALFTACTKDQNWSAGEQAQGAQVYFVDGVATSVTAEAETSSFEVTLMRAATDEAVTVPVKTTFGGDYAELFTVPSNVSFGAGKDTAKITVSFDRAALTDGETYSFTFAVNDAGAVTPYGYDKQTWTLVVPEPFVLLGTAIYRDDIVASAYNLGGFPVYEVEVYENTNTPGVIYLKNLYTHNFPVSGLDIVPGYEGDTYFAINIADPNEVFIPVQSLGISYADYGAMMVGTAVPGTLVNGVITFPAEAFVFAEANYKDGAWYMYANASGMFLLALPGAVLTDYSLEVAYGGFRVADDNETIYPIARAAYGADVAEIQYAFVAGDITKDVEALTAALAGIEDGSVVSNKVAVTTTTNADGEEVNEMMLESIDAKEAGVYTVIAIPYSADGEAQYGDLACASFYVQGVGAAETPEVDLELEWMPFSEALPDYSAEYPDHSTWCSLIYGSEIKSMKYFLNTTETVDYYLSLGLTEQDMIDQAGSDFDPSDINENGVGIIYFTGVPADTSFTLVVWAENNYGKTVIKTASGATAAAPESAKVGGAKLSWDRINGKQIAFNPNKGISFSTIK